MKVVLLRHGATAGNLEKRFLGITDENLCETGVEKLKNKKNILNKKLGGEVNITKVYVSPLSRCMTTADILFPNYDKKIIENFRECNFGILENKTHEELLEDKLYLDFISCSDADCFPRGERIQDFLNRCADVFYEIVSDSTADIVCVVHGGTIMGIMDRFAGEKYIREYYKWSPDNGCGYIGDIIKSGDDIVIEDIHEI